MRELSDTFDGGRLPTRLYAPGKAANWRLLCRPDAIEKVSFHVHQRRINSQAGHVLRIIGIGENFARPPDKTEGIAAVNLNCLQATDSALCRRGIGE